MNKKLEILLVEDDPVTCKEFINLVDESDDLILVGVTNNASKAMDYIKEMLPDAIILDLELNEGSGNGLNILFDLQTISLAKSPYILITTNNTSTYTYDTARKLGADFIMSKHQENYSPQYALDFLRMISSVIKNKQKLTTQLDNTTESAEHYNRRITRIIMAELDRVGINPKSVGYQYLVDGIKIMSQGPTQNICRLIAKEHNKTDASVERAMQNAINRAWRTTNIDDLLRYYTAKINSYRGNPTVTEFICYYAKKIKSEY